MDLKTQLYNDLIDPILPPDLQRNAPMAKKRKREQVTCRCDAYPFPHRLHSKQCLELAREMEAQSGKEDYGARIDREYQEYRQEQIDAGTWNK